MHKFCACLNNHSSSNTSQNFFVGGGGGARLQRAMDCVSFWQWIVQMPRAPINCAAFVCFNALTLIQTKQAGIELGLNQAEEITNQVQNTSGP